MKSILPAVAALLILAAPAMAGRAADEDVSLTAEELKALETFEAHSLAKADKAYAAGNHKQAGALYQAFILEYPKSKVLPYALMRVARSSQLDRRRFEAIKQYNEVLDYFPNHVRYAAASLYYQGTCHWDNGDKDDAMKAWAKMARDKDYRKHFLAAGAINRLADHLVEKNQPADAVGYYEQVAADFRTANVDAARHAIAHAVWYHVRTSPNEEKLRAFYDKVGTFRDRPEKVSGKTDESRPYWAAVIELVRRCDRFSEEEAEIRTRYFQYWSGAMAGRFADWDDYQIALADFARVADGSDEKWIKRLDEQYARGLTDGDSGRAIRWMRLFRGNKPKMMEYYNKLDFAKLNFDQTFALMKALYEDMGDAEMGGNCFDKFKLGELTDPQRSALGWYIGSRDPKKAEVAFLSMDDRDAGRYELLKFYQARRMYDEGVKLAPDVAAVAAYASDARYRQGQMLQALKKYAEAIGAYQQADNPPSNLWPIADCYAAMGKTDAAVGQLREIEGFFKEQAPQAALKIADVYKRANMKDLQVAALRAVLKKYPKSSQSQSAHQALEEMGLKTGGGVDAE